MHNTVIERHDAPRNRDRALQLAGSTLAGDSDRDGLVVGAELQPTVDGAGIGGCTATQRGVAALGPVAWCITVCARLGTRLGRQRVGNGVGEIDLHDCGWLGLGKLGVAEVVGQAPVCTQRWRIGYGLHFPLRPYGDAERSLHYSRCFSVAAPLTLKLQQWLAGGLVSSHVTRQLLNGYELQVLEALNVSIFTIVTARLRHTPWCHTHATLATRTHSVGHVRIQVLGSHFLDASLNVVEQAQVGVLTSLVVCLQELTQLTDGCRIVLTASVGVHFRKEEVSDAPDTLTPHVCHTVDPNRAWDSLGLAECQDFVVDGACHFFDGGGILQVVHKDEALVHGLQGIACWFDAWIPTEQVFLDELVNLFLHVVSAQL